MKYLSFDDYLILPKFSEINSRKDINLDVSIAGMNLKNGIFSANMDSVTGPEMAAALISKGSAPCLHRFQTIDENVAQFKKTIELVEKLDLNNDYNKLPVVSIGSSELEFDRAKALINAGARTILIDMAHGATQLAVDQFNKCKFEFLHAPKIRYIVGNFATQQSLKEFLNRTKWGIPDVVKIGIGGGSVCTTRMQTGCGLPTMSSLLECRNLNIPMIACGGIKNSGDIAKALAAGAKGVMLGSLLAATNESPGKIITEGNKYYMEYRGSASLESYQVQGKVSEHRTAEGETTLIPYKGFVSNVVDNLTAGVRSAFSYVGALNFTEFQEKAQLVEITQSGFYESKPHGKH